MGCLPTRLDSPLPPAGFIKRFVAAMMDGALLVAVGLVSFGMLGALLGGILWVAGLEVPPPATASLGLLYSVALVWLYFTLFESSALQATPGKLALGLAITDLNGHPVTFGRANGRFLGKILSAFTLFAGFILAAFTKKRQSLHDMLAGSLVVDTVVLPPPLPQWCAPSRWSPWATVGIGAVIGVVFVVLQGVIVFIAMIYRAETDSGFDPEVFLLGIEEEGFIVMLATSMALMICAGLTLLFTKIRQGLSVAEYLALHPVSGRTLLKLTGLTIMFLILSDTLSFLIDQPVQTSFMMDIYMTRGSTLLLLFAIVFAAPVAEELFFRGFLFEGLRYSRLGMVGTILLTSLFWAVIHVQYDLYHIIVIFIFGLMLCGIRLKTGSVWSCVYVHALNNLVATLQTFYFVEILME